MSSEYIDGFDTYATADLFLGRWDGFVNLAPVVSTANPRTGTKSLLFGTSQNSSVYRNLGGNRATVIVGGAFHNANLTSSLWPVFMFNDGSPSSVQITIAVDTFGKIRAYRGTVGGTLLDTSLVSVGSSGTFIHIAAKVTFHGSSGVIVVRVNDVAFLTLTGIDTTNTANNYCNQVLLGYNALNGTYTPAVYLDDFYIFNGLGSDCNDFPGDVGVYPLTVNGNGSTQNFTPTPGSNNSANVDDTTPDGDSTFNSSPTINHIDLYTHTAAPTLGAIYTVQTCLVARKDDAGSIHVSSVCKSGGTTGVGSVDNSLTNNYRAYLDNFATDPATGVAWTLSGLNAAELGGKIIS